MAHRNVGTLPRHYTTPSTSVPKTIIIENYDRAIYSSETLLHWKRWPDSRVLQYLRREEEKGTQNQSALSFPTVN
jgi:hypothetical protein